MRGVRLPSPPSHFQMSSLSFRLSWSSVSGMGGELEDAGFVTVSEGLWAKAQSG